MIGIPGQPLFFFMDFPLKIGMDSVISPVFRRMDCCNQRKGPGRFEMACSRSDDPIVSVKEGDVFVRHQFPGIADESMIQIDDPLEEIIFIRMERMDPVDLHSFDFFIWKHSRSAGCQYVDAPPLFGKSGGKIMHMS